MTYLPDNKKIFIRFFDNRDVRALWDGQNAKWWFSVLDINAFLTDQNNYTKTLNYRKYLKSRLNKENNKVVSLTTQFKFLALDGKRRLADMLDYNGIIALGKQFPGKTDYMNLMIKSAINSNILKNLLKNALTDKINFREIYEKN